MPNVRIADKRIWVGDQSRPLLHGEVHFWRLSPIRWSEVLRSVKELGIDIISSAVHGRLPRAARRGQHRLPGHCTVA